MKIHLIYGSTLFAVEYCIIKYEIFMTVRFREIAFWTTFVHLILLHRGSSKLSASF